MGHFRFHVNFQNILSNSTAGNGSSYVPVLVVLGYIASKGDPIYFGNRQPRPFHLLT